MIELYNQNAFLISRQTTKLYSTSFSLGIRMLKKKYRMPVYAIYGFVRFADEIVDTFHEYDKQTLFLRFKEDTFKAIEEKISLNPILQSFQLVVHEFNIDRGLIDAFLFSMEMDITKTTYNREQYDRYIYGSAEAVGLMCLKVFYKNNEEEYEKLRYPARKLGQAFQKINFLRDIRSDFKGRGRIYFPNINLEQFSEQEKKQIEHEIENDFKIAMTGICHLHQDVRLGVYLANEYFLALLKKIEKTDPKSILNKRFRIHDLIKIYILIKSVLKNYLGLFPSCVLNLKVSIDDNSGFCFGVINAITKAEKFLKENEKIYCLGEIVHNEEEIQRLKHEGVVFINQENFRELKNSTVLFRAHGEPPESYLTAQDNNTLIIDASCSIILKFQKRIIESYRNNEKIYIYGKKNHPEIIGLNGQINNEAVIFETIDELDFDHMLPGITLYSQTTKSREKFKGLAEIIRSKGIEVNLKDTICNQVANREQQLKNFAKQFDVIVFVAGRNSSNGKVLFDFCKQVNERTHFISNCEEINLDWFTKNNKVGICGATSTPMWLMQQVKGQLELL